MEKDGSDECWGWVSGDGSVNEAGHNLKMKNRSSYLEMVFRNSFGKFHNKKLLRPKPLSELLSHLMPFGLYLSEMGQTKKWSNKKLH